MRAAALVVLFGLAWSCSTFDCNSVTCTQGCCDNGVCFEGTSMRNGVPCRGAGGGSGGSGGAGGGTAGGAAGGGGWSSVCLAEGVSCTEGGPNQCCFPTACVGGTCIRCVGKVQRCDLSPLPCCYGTCGGDWCPFDCASSTTPCNDAKPCCKTFSSDRYSEVCINERCTFCSTVDHECKKDDPLEVPCCPGLRCALKPGFTTVFTCQQ